MNAHFFRTLAKSAIATALLTLLTASPLQSQVPQLINYQGRVTVGATNFDGVGQFKFALVNTTGTTTYWSNDNSSVAGSQPLAAVQQTVTKGLYAVLLGDTTLGNMTAIPSGVFSNTDVRLRVWFNDGTSGSQLLTPDQRIAAVGYAMMAANVPDGAITTGKLADGAVGTAQLADGAVSSAKISPGAAVANLNASGQSGVAKDGLVLSAKENPALVAAGYVKIGLMQTEDHWEELSNGTVPSPRAGHTATWTGSEMIVWGGGDHMGRGGSRPPGGWRAL